MFAVLGTVVVYTAKAWDSPPPRGQSRFCCFFPLSYYVSICEIVHLSERLQPRIPIMRRINDQNQFANKFAPTDAFSDDKIECRRELVPFVTDGFMAKKDGGNLEVKLQKGMQKRIRCEWFFLN